MFWIELLIVLAIIFVGVRLSGPFLAFAGGIGMLIITFGLHVKPSDPPVTVILIMIAVICAAGMMQSCGGLDYLVKIAEKILRKNPKMVTVLAPIVAYIFTFMCGTGHIIYSLLPVINEISIETGKTDFRIYYFITAGNHSVSDFGSDCQCTGVSCRITVHICKYFYIASGMCSGNSDRYSCSSIFCFEKR